MIYYQGAKPVPHNEAWSNMGPNSHHQVSSPDAIDYPRPNNYHPHPALNGKPVQVRKNINILGRSAHTGIDRTEAVEFRLLRGSG